MRDSDQGMWIQVARESGYVYFCSHRTSEIKKKIKAFFKYFGKISGRQIEQSLRGKEQAGTRKNKSVLSFLRMAPVTLQCISTALLKCCPASKLLDPLRQTFWVFSTHFCSTFSTYDFLSLPVITPPHHNTLGLGLSVLCLESLNSMELWKNFLYCFVFFYSECQGCWEALFSSRVCQFPCSLPWKTSYLMEAA